MVMVVEIYCWFSDIMKINLAKKYEGKKKMTKKTKKFIYDRKRYYINDVR